MVGVTNTGKSTLINRIIKELTGVEDLITTSRFPGTTLDRIMIPLDDGQSLIDTPGIIHRHQMAHFVGPKDLKLVSPTSVIKPATYQLNEGQTIFLGGLARFDYLRGGRNSFVIYTDNQLTLHRTKLENADDFYQKHVGGLLSPPQADEVTDFPPLVRFEFTPKEKSRLSFRRVRLDHCACWCYGCRLCAKRCGCFVTACVHLEKLSLVSKLIMSK